MDPIRLVFAYGPRKGKKLWLEKTDKGLELVDKEGNVHSTVPNGQASTRIRFPSFLGQRHES